MLKVSTKDNVPIIEIIAANLEMEELKSALNLAISSHCYKIILNLNKIENWPLSDEVINYLYENRQFFVQNNGDIKIIIPSKIKTKIIKRFNELDIATYPTADLALADF